MIALFKHKNIIIPKKAYSELENGEKTSHWIWYIFPQLQGLGSSPNAVTYGIKDLQEACDFLQNKELFENYHKITLLVSQQLDTGIALQTLMGSSIDASKLASSMTLFYATASFMTKQGKHEHDYAQLAQLCDQILTKIKAQGYSPCKKTIKMISLQIEQITLQEPQQTSIAQSKESPSLFFTKQHKEQPPQTSAPSHHDYSALNTALDDYLKTRKKEWSFHYNFLGFVALVYLIQDAVLGTDHFNSKSREIKISASEKLKALIAHPEKKDSIVFSNSEKHALAEGRLGKIVSSNGGLHDILKTIEQEPKQDQHPTRFLD